MPVSTRNELWTKVQRLLQENLSKPSYETWIRPAEFFDFKDGCLTLLAPNSFSSDWLRKNYSQKIEEIATEIFGHQVKVYIKVKDEFSINKSNKKKTYSNPDQIISNASRDRSGGGLNQAPIKKKITGVESSICF